MTQTRMHEIELLLNPYDSIMNSGETLMSIGGGSWIELLLNSGTYITPESYTALYTSPTSLHPPLQLRLTVPDEPGFLLEKVPVQTIKQVWAILEVVREQCWVNEIIKGCEWVPEDPDSVMNMPAANAMDTTEEATDVELQAILSGTSQGSFESLSM